MKRLLMTCCVGLCVAVAGAVSAQEEEIWFAVPAPTGMVGNNFDDGGDRYVFPGQTLSIYVGDISDKDTKCPDELVDEFDVLVRGQMIQTEATLTGADPEWKSQLLIPGKRVHIEYTISANATEGQWVKLAFCVRDRRRDNDPRHDDWEVIQAWKFIVRESDKVPTLAVDSITDITGQVPAYTTLGIATVRMVAGGDPPDGAPNWNGTVITERLGNFEGNPSHLTQKAAKEILGQHPNGGKNSSFTIGRTGVNKFNDRLTTNFLYITLETGVKNTMVSYQHDYKYRDTIYQFVGKCFMERKFHGPGEPYVKVTRTIE